MLLFGSQSILQPHLYELHPFFAVLHVAKLPRKDILLAKPNYSFEKRQRDLEKKRKQEDKRMRKLTDKKPADDANTATEETTPSVTEDSNNV